MRNILKRRVAKKVDRERKDRRFVLRSQIWVKRGLICIVECMRCGGGGGASMKGGLGKFVCDKCGRHGDMYVVRQQFKKEDLKYVGNGVRL